MTINMQRGLASLRGVPMAQAISETFAVCTSSAGRSYCNHPNTLNAQLNNLLVQLEGSVGHYVGFGQGSNLQSDLDSFDKTAQSFCASLAGSDQSCTAMDVQGLVNQYKQRFIDFLKGNIAAEYFAGTTTLYMVQPGKTLYDYASGGAVPEFNPGPATTPSGGFNISRAGGSGTQGGGPVLGASYPQQGAVVANTPYNTTVNPISTAPSALPTTDLLTGSGSRISEEAAGLLSGIDGKTLLIGAVVVGALIFMGGKK